MAPEFVTLAVVHRIVKGFGNAAIRTTVSVAVAEIVSEFDTLAGVAVGDAVGLGILAPAVPVAIAEIVPEFVTIDGCGLYLRGATVEIMPNSHWRWC